MTTNKKVNDNPDNDSITVEAPFLENVFHWTEERDCYKNQFMDNENKFQYPRWEPVEETRWNNFKVKCVDPKTGGWYTSGEGTGRCLGKEGPKRIVTSIIRLKTSNGAEYLLSNSTIIGYSAYGDKQITTAGTPEKYNKMLFKYETVPNFETGFQDRRNVGPQGSTVVYMMPFNKENATKLFDMRDTTKQELQFTVKSEEGKVYSVKPQATVEDTFKLFVESDFEYLYNGNYISMEQKLLAMKQAELEGFLPKMTDDDRAVTLQAQKNLSQADKMQSYG